MGEFDLFASSVSQKFPDRLQVLLKLSIDKLHSLFRGIIVRVYSFKWLRYSFVVGPRIPNYQSLKLCYRGVNLWEKWLESCLL